MALFSLTIAFSFAYLKVFIWFALRLNSKKQKKGRNSTKQSKPAVNSAFWRRNSEALHKQIIQPKGLNYVSTFSRSLYVFCSKQQQKHTLQHFLLSMFLERMQPMNARGWLAGLLLVGRNRRLLKEPKKLNWIFYFLFNFTPFKYSVTNLSAFRWRKFPFHCS